MRLLLDTHVWLWMLSEPDRLEPSVRSALEDTSNELLLSAASSWEIAIKYRLGKLALPEPPERFIPPRLARDGIVPLPITHGHATLVAELPDHHRDPFDRLLVAQALRDDLLLVTADPKVERYEARTLAAG